ncbi:MAG: 50S ribosomal protein L29 [Gemmatimonadetes bacterium]|nr:50S ribosomal protein L29 [Gemmatimonadota bacterium]NIR81093.1 50S ribosomal protein L29 [Gemmatimonadota bacterium]NIT89911.1 50S ribosomal protein L29 [Gemmatimonadota bacterium]NIU33710.1 50S ribosomal protein L29 [Gemmatimonadota bacterium]NIV64036.1 50S ribosomal protein L29 [Gemmatimonadota bacterium]
MKPEEIRDFDDDQIRRRIRELEEEKFRLRFRSATMELENPKLIETIRRDIARMKTILHERKRAREAEAATAAAGSTEAED